MPVPTISSEAKRSGTFQKEDIEGKIESTESGEEWIKYLSTLEAATQ